MFIDSLIAQSMLEILENITDEVIDDELLDMLLLTDVVLEETPIKCKFCKKIRLFMEELMSSFDEDQDEDFDYDEVAL
jgi:hypothetical protein